MHEENGLRPVKIGIVGTGRVGSTFAYTLLLRGAVGEIVLVDLNHRRAEGEAMDLNHAAPLTHPVRIWAGDYADLAGAQVVMVAAGVAQREGESRLDLVRRNVAVFNAVIPKIVANNPGGIILIATNPVDILSYVAWKLSGLPWTRVIGSGTVLDTARFRHLISQRIGVDPRNIHAYIIGEHGDSEVPVWSRATAAGIPINRFCSHYTCTFTPTDQEEIFTRTKNAAYEIIARKGATYYAVAAALARIVESIIHDQRSILPVSTRVPSNYEMGELYLSLPAVVRRTGVEEVLHVPLVKKELDQLHHSATLLTQIIAELATKPQG